jgi:hypothetical protein
MNDAVLGRRPQPGPPVPDVIGVGTRQDGAVTARERQRAQHFVQLCLAVVAAVAFVPPVALLPQLVRVD